ncbi:hypothetical protein NX722_14120 [Endozoicomonas gorgoniicola]|uniref:Uncharacterized protein n=1 Tax=Endozoicomonas gorgoniicola TaxID=1234144 RepID=A0ABT3MWI7_9GAMM|nr:hypothetical protein [Endozoicomonas gorgoniicola]MCW7553746.1 hypothetical protein [Endozoicomonas gorgoniicola]
MKTKRQEISFDDHYKGDDYSYWGRALLKIAEYFGEYVNLKMGWHEPFEEGKTPFEAFLEEYPEHSEGA